MTHIIAITAIVLFSLVALLELRSLNGRRCDRYWARREAECLAVGRQCWSCGHCAENEQAARAAAGGVE